MLEFTTGASFSDESMSLAALIMSTNEITLNSFPSQETIREYSTQQGFM